MDVGLSRTTGTLRCAACSAIHSYLTAVSRQRASKRDLIGKVSLEQCITEDASTSRAQYVMVLRKIDDEPEVKTHISCTIDLVSSCMENFTALRHKIRETTLNLPTKVPIVAIGCSSVGEFHPARRDLVRTAAKTRQRMRDSHSKPVLLEMRPIACRQRHFRARVRFDEPGQRLLLSDCVRWFQRA